MNHPELQVGCCHRAEPLWSSSVRPTHRNMSALLSRCNIKLCSSEHLTWNLEDESDMQMASLAEPCGPINPNCWLMLCSISCSLHQDQTAAGVPAVLPAVLQVRTAAATHSLTPPTHTRSCVATQNSHYKPGHLRLSCMLTKSFTMTGMTWHVFWSGWF